MAKMTDAEAVNRLLNMTEEELQREKDEILKEGNIRSIQEKFDAQDWMQGYRVLDIWRDQTRVGKRGAWYRSWHLKIATPYHGTLEFSCADTISTYNEEFTDWGIHGEWMFTEDYYSVSRGGSDELHDYFLNGKCGDDIRVMIECYANEVACQHNLTHAYSNLDGKKIVIQGACEDHIIAETEDGWDVLIIAHPPERMNKMLGIPREEREFSENILRRFYNRTSKEVK